MTLSCCFSFLLVQRWLNTTATTTWLKKTHNVHHTDKKWWVLPCLIFLVIVTWHLMHFFIRWAHSVKTRTRSAKTLKHKWRSTWPPVTVLPSTSTHLHRPHCAGRGRREPAEPAQSRWGIRWAPVVWEEPGWSWCWVWCGPAAGWHCSGPVHMWWPADAATWQTTHSCNNTQKPTHWYFLELFLNPWIIWDRQFNVNVALKIYSLVYPLNIFDRTCVVNTCVSQRSSWWAAALCCLPPGPEDSCPCGWHSWCQPLPVLENKPSLPRHSALYSPEDPRRSAVDTHDDDDGRRTWKWG